MSVVSLFGHLVRWRYRLVDLIAIFSTELIDHHNLIGFVVSRESFAQGKSLFLVKRFVD